MQTTNVTVFAEFNSGGSSLPVVGWDDEGTPLVVYNGQRRRATMLPGYGGLVTGEPDAVFVPVPSHLPMWAGWRDKREDMDEDERWYWTPVVAFAQIAGSACLHPVITSDGMGEICTGNEIPDAIAFGTERPSGPPSED